MYGKHYASMYTGSMYGAGTTVFAVWGYVIGNAINSQVELNPAMLANSLGGGVDEITAAIEYLCSPDPNSRSKADEGRRLIQEGQFAFRVVNHDTYKVIRNEEERREYNRQKKAEQRERDKLAAQ